VLLYELLTGRTPFDAKELLRAGLDEMRRRIREEEPLRPSTRLSTMADADLTEVAQRRQSDPAKLARFIRGDLDWIVMKCLEKDRTRRYETANGLAMDLRRYLGNEPVTACPPSAAYRFQKLVRRNKLTVAALGSIAATLILGLGISTWLWLAEREANYRMRAMMKFFTDTQVLRTAAPKEFKDFAAGSTNRIAWVVPPGDARLKDKTYTQLTADWLQWALQMPKTNSAGAVHPWIESESFDLTASQSSNVWFLGAPFRNTQRHGTIPAGTALFFPLFIVEASSIEPPPFYGASAEDQAVVAQYFAGHILAPFCEVDRVPLSNIETFRVLSPQVKVNVPAPWILGETGGSGTATGAGYFVFLSPLPPGDHTLRFGGSIRLTYPQDLVDFDGWIDITYHLNVKEPPRNSLSASR